MRVLLYFLFLGAMLKLHAQTVLANHEFEAENIQEILIDGKFCNIFVTTGDRVKFQGMIEGSGKPGDYQISSNLNGARLEIKVEKKFKTASSSLSEARFDLTVPKEIQLTIKNASGNVFVAGVNGSHHQVETISGNITLEKMAGDIEVESKSGNIKVTNMFGPLKVKTTSGDQVIEGLSGNLYSKLTSGNLELKGTTGEVDCEATSGNISLDGVEGKLLVKTTSGNIEGSAITLTDDAEFSASSGNIKIRFKDGLDKIGFNLKSGSGNLSVGEEKTQHLYVLQRDQVEVRGVTTSGNQEYLD